MNRISMPIMLSHLTFLSLRKRFNRVKTSTDADGSRSTPDYHSQNSSNAVVDDEPTTTTDWQPEIPFRNVIPISITFSFVVQAFITPTDPFRFAFGSQQLSDTNVADNGNTGGNGAADVDAERGERRGAGSGAQNRTASDESMSPSSLTAEEVDGIIDENIQITTNKMMRNEYLWQWSLKFKDPIQERRYSKLPELMFRSNVICVLTLWAFIVVCQMFVAPHCDSMIIGLVVASITLMCGCVLVLAEEFSHCPGMLRRQSNWIVRHRTIRTLYICSSILIMTVAGANTMMSCDVASYIDCKSDKLFQLQNTTTPKSDVYPDYIVYTWVLCLVSVSTGLKVYYLVKTFLAFLMVFFYGTLILHWSPHSFHYKDVERFQSLKLIGMPMASQMVILLVIFLTMVTYHARLVEVTARLDFMWKEQAERELSKMKGNRTLANILIKNILPDHVASYYLSAGRTDDQLYAMMHHQCGVMFASIPNFRDFYSEDIENGKACIRVLNEIICDFDSLLEDPQFVTVEKIKTTGSTYMAASGLNPKVQQQLGLTDEDCICIMVDFALAMRQKLIEVNKDAFNNFNLRVGISSGPLVSGVIGARKPVYDIWGNTVNVASRMESTGELWRIQVPDYTAELLTRCGYRCAVSNRPDARHAV